MASATSSAAIAMEVPLPIIPSYSLPLLIPPSSPFQFSLKTHFLQATTKIVRFQKIKQHIILYNENSDLEDEVMFKAVGVDGKGYGGMERWRMI